jgi:hypothetical protein
MQVLPQCGNVLNSIPFKSVEPRVNLNAKNVAVNSASRKSQYLDFNKPDRIDDILFSEIIWKTVRGEKSIMPSSRREAFVKLLKKEVEKEDED